MSHTPGPWTFDDVDTISSSETNEDIATLIAVKDRNYTNGGKYNTEIMDANARLIAAAPELLTELEHELEDLDGWLSDDGISDDTKESMLIREDKIQKAIRKAKGEL